MESLPLDGLEAPGKVTFTLWTLFPRYIKQRWDQVNPKGPFSYYILWSKPKINLLSLKKLMVWGAWQDETAHLVNAGWFSESIWLVVGHGGRTISLCVLENEFHVCREGGITKMCSLPAGIGWVLYYSVLMGSASLAGELRTHSHSCSLHGTVYQSCFQDPPNKGIIHCPKSLETLVPRITKGFIPVKAGCQLNLGDLGYMPGSDSEWHVVQLWGCDTLPLSDLVFSPVQWWILS